MIPVSRFNIYETNRPTHRVAATLSEWKHDPVIPGLTWNPVNQSSLLGKENVFTGFRPWITSFQSLPPAYDMQGQARAGTTAVYGDRA